MGIIEALPKIITAIINGLVECLPQLIKGCVQLVIELVKHLPEIILALIKAIPTIIKSIVEALMNGLGSIVEVGKNLVTGLWNGISNAAQWLWDKVSGWISGLWDGILGFFGIHSPSTKMRDIVGKNLVLGLAQGITREGDTAVQAMEDVAGDIAAVTFAPMGMDMSAITDSLNNAIPLDFDSRFNASVMTGSAFNDSLGFNRPQTFNNNITFGNVIINDGSDVEDIAHQVSDIIVSDIMVKGGAYA